mgnify:CR=1 FL=1
MISGREALEFLDQVYAKIDFQDAGQEKLFCMMKNRFAYQISQAEPVKLKYHKGIHSSIHDYWTCQNCGCRITHSVIQEFCWNCGHAIEWDWPRCLTGKKAEKEGEDNGKQEEE